MGCGCKNKKRQKPPSQEPSQVYSVNGGPTVPLGLKDVFHLPMRLEDAINGKDVVIVANRKNMPNLNGSVVLIGRNANMRPEDRQQLVQKWPKAFANA